MFGFKCDRVIVTFCLKCDKVLITFCLKEKSSFDFSRQERIRQESDKKRSVFFFLLKEKYCLDHKGSISLFHFLGFYMTRYGISL